jgi:tripartite-type tricarboxylate transporter receptor subunit TctC
MGFLRLDTHGGATVINAQAGLPPSLNRDRTSEVDVTDTVKRSPYRNFIAAYIAYLCFAVVATSFWSAPVAAQAYPARPVTMIVPFPAGGPADTPGRVIAERMRKSLGQPVVIENVSGAAGSIGTGRVARAKADGYTIVLGNVSTHVVNAALYSLPYDVLNDFAPISPLVTTPLLLFARKAMPAEDLPELIDWLKANPGRASAGYGSVTFQAMNIAFQKQTGTSFALIPYRGTALGIQDLVAGQIDLYFTTPSELPLLRAGSIKAYAVTSDTRLALAPEIPTFAELGLPSLSFANWYALFAPGGTPPDIIAKLNAAAVEALADPVVRSRLVDLGTDPFPHDRQTAEALGVLQKADAQKWWPIIREAGLKGE